MPNNYELVCVLGFTIGALGASIFVYGLWKIAEDLLRRFGEK